MRFLGWLVGADLGEGSLEFVTPTWALASYALAALLALVVAGWSAFKARPALPEILSLAIGLAVVAFAAAGPTWIEESGRLEEGRFVVLIDDSRSMAVLEDGEPRFEQVDDALSELDLSRAEVYTFGSELHVGAEPTFGGGGSDLAGALRAVSERHAGEKLAGVVVITDGIDRGGLRREVENHRPPELELPGPLTLYQVGEPGEVQDLSVVDLSTGGFAFLHSPFTITAEISGAGYEDTVVQVVLAEDGRVVARSQAQLDSSGLGSASFELTSGTPGRYIYEVSVPADEDDAVPGNNTMAVAVRVVRDKLRILQVCGAPSLDEKFLRLFLKQDPGIELVSFFILRTNEDLRTGYLDRELSLIKFPYRTLFTPHSRDGELDTFDLVIFQNFDWASFFPYEPNLLQNVEAYVRGGKAFVMMGGDRSFDRGRYEGTAIESILPVELGVDGEAVDLEAFSPHLTEAGRVHPVTRLLGTEADNEALWGRLPVMDGLNLSAGMAPGSATLLSHPTLLTPDGQPAPVLAVREVGEGRTMSLMGDSSWRWVMTEAARGGGNQAYLRFWKNSIRWLVKDHDGQRVQVDTTRENHRVGDTIRIVAKVRDVGFQPMKEIEVVGQLTGAGEAISFSGLTDASGELVVEVPAEARGAWTASIAAGPEGALGSDSTSFAVTDRDPELEELQPAEGFLAQLAEQTGGVHYTPGDYDEPLVDMASGRTVEERRETPLWAAPVIPILAGLSLSLSWWLRRRRGLR